MQYRVMSRSVCVEWLHIKFYFNIYKIDRVVASLCWLMSISRGGCLELGWLQNRISCGCSPNDNFLNVSIKSVYSGLWDILLKDPLKRTQRQSKLETGMPPHTHLSPINNQWTYLFFLLFYSSFPLFIVRSPNLLKLCLSKEQKRLLILMLCVLATIEQIFLKRHLCYAKLAISPHCRFYFNYVRLMASICGWGQTIMDLFITKCLTLKQTKWNHIQHHCVGHLAFMSFKNTQVHYRKTCQIPSFSLSFI